jgi:hypothetical protein
MSCVYRPEMSAQEETIRYVLYDIRELVIVISTRERLNMFEGILEVELACEAYQRSAPL